MASVYKDLLKRRIEAAQGIIPCDLVLKNCRIIDVYTQSIREGDIAVITASSPVSVVHTKGGASSMPEGGMPRRASSTAISTSSRPTSVRKNSAASSFPWGRRRLLPILMKSPMSAGWLD
ncbi:hypothetical protein [Megasphaera sp. SW808]|uniref:hypothetical protein n=1 Tax=Megasphaera sp. SW808 TaxID=2530045 RepID=UPI003211F0A8